MIIQQIKNTLDKLGLNHNVICEKESQTVINLKMQLDSTNSDCYIDIRHPFQQLIIRSISSSIVPEHKRFLIAEFIARVNSICRIGNFELDMETGSFEYKCSYIYDESAPKSESIFTDNLEYTFNALNKFFPGIMSIIYGGRIPKSEFLSIIGSMDPSLN